MEGISNNTAVNRPNYHATAKGAIGGAAAGAAILGSGYGSIKATQAIMKKADFATKKEFLNGIAGMLKIAKVDSSKTTVSKLFKTATKEYLKPKFIAKTVAPLAAAGAAIGFGVDLVKNHLNSSKKA